MRNELNFILNMFEIFKKSKISAFNMNNEKKVLDRFELIIKIHRFIGILYYGYYEKESKIKYILFGFYNFIMFSIVLIISSPCLLSHFNCDKKTNYYNKDIQRYYDLFNCKRFYWNRLESDILKFYL